MHGIKVGDQVRIKQTGEVVFVHGVVHDQPYPYYVHHDESPDTTDSLRGPYHGGDLEAVKEG